MKGQPAATKSGRKDQDRTKWGFTSLELLVVLMMLVILLTIILPALIQPTGRASLVCRNNLRQIGESFMMYAQDYSDTVPGWGWEFHDPSYATPPDRRFLSGELQADFTTGKLWSYVGRSPRLFRCPAYTLRTAASPRFWGFNATSPALPYPLWSYTANVTAELSCRTSTDGSLDLKIGKLHTPPATTVLALEPGNTGFDNGVAIFSGKIPAENQDHLETRYHVDVGNLAFMDGHAIGMTWKQYTNACTGLEKAKQFFGGSYEFIW